MKFYDKIIVLSTEHTKTCFSDICKKNQKQTLHWLKYKPKRPNISVERAKRRHWQSTKFRRPWENAWRQENYRKFKETWESGQRKFDMGLG